MKKIKTIWAVALTAALAGCNDLNTEPLGSTVTQAQKEATAAANPSIVEASVNSVMSMFSSEFLALGESSSYHNDYGYGSVMLMMDSRGRDLVSTTTGYNWYSSALEYADIVVGSAYLEMIWKTMYNQLYSANSLLANTYADGEMPEDDALRYYTSQALAVRAFDYWVLAQLFQQNYEGNEDKLSIPLVTHLNADEAALAGGLERGTVQEAYDLILGDLTTAIEMLEGCQTQRATTRSGKAFVDAAVVYGLRARVYMTMHNYTAALADVQQALSLTTATPYTMAEVSAPTFATSEDHAWMWAINIEESDDVVQSGIINWISHMGSLNYGYASVGAWRAIADDLWQSIPSTDVRKGWWLDDNGQSANLTAAQQEYVDGAGMDLHTQVKFAPYNDEIYTGTNANDIPLMRVEELYLMLAECQAMTGNPAAGAATLQSFVSTYRNPSYTCNASSAEGVQQAVYYQRRIELWGEGLSWFDHMRLGTGVDRRGAGFEAAVVFNIAAGDPCLIYPIPNCELQANSNITASETATAPQPVEDN